MPITSLTAEAVTPAGLGRKQAALCKNMFTLGIVSWIYERSVDDLKTIIDAMFGVKRPQMAAANKLAVEAGYNYADTVEIFTGKFHIAKAQLPQGTYRRVTGNEATALGFLAASEVTGLPLFYGSYPITPASDILHELSKLRHFGVRTFQAEDEIAAIGAAIGAAYGGSLGLTGSSGPGIALKSEFIGLAVMAELPLVVADIQRGGPSTGLPTKTEQADLLQCMFGRNGECPVAIVAPSGPGECFDMALESFRIALEHMTPVFFLSDGYIANGSEPWRIPGRDELPSIKVEFHDDPGGSSPTPAIQRHSSGLGRSPARRASNTALAASRRKTSAVWSATIRPITKRWCTCASARSTTSPTAFRISTSSAPTPVICWSSAGAAPGGRSGTRSKTRKARALR